MAADRRTPLRILHISTRLILGGSQENTVLSCEGQARLGHEVHLAFGPIYGPEGSLLERVTAFRAANGAGITTHIVPNMVRQIAPRRDWRALGELKALIAQLKPDVVHTHSSKAGIVGRAAAWAVLRGSPARRPAVVHTIHGPPFMPVEGGLVTRLKARVINHGYTLAERSAAGRGHLTVSVADAMTTQFLDRGIGRAEQYVTVRSGMGTGPYLHAAAGESAVDVRARLGIANDAFVIGTVARLAQHKGHDDLLDALGDELRRRPDWCLLWVGDGWWRERLVARARALGLSVNELDRDAPAEAPGSPRQLVITGLVPPERIPGLMRAMSVLVHPSSREGLPRTVPQALLCGTPVVAYDADGTREACLDPSVVGEEQSTGRLVAVGDRDGLREAVAWTASHHDEATAMAARGRAMCAQAFSAEAMVAGLERVYARALAMCDATGSR